MRNVLAVLAMLMLASCGGYHNPDDTAKIKDLQTQLADANARAADAEAKAAKAEAQLTEEATAARERVAEAAERSADAQEWQAQSAADAASAAQEQADEGATEIGHHFQNAPLPKAMGGRIAIDVPDGAFGAYIARPAELPAPAVVVLQELFGVNADIRKTCDELAEQGFIAVAPDLFWRQEPGVDLGVRSDADWQHGLRLYQAYDRDTGVKDIKATVAAAAALPDSSGKVAVLGYCLGALMVFLTAVRSEVDAAVWYHGGDTEKYLDEVGALHAPMLMHLAEEDEFISKPAQAQIKAAVAGKPNVTVYSYPGQRHAFSRHNGAHYDASAAALAHGRTYEFLNRELR